jgi:predicted  nucleic acid-binding Zn-ribbon protein
MWFPIVAWIVLVSAAAFFAGATLNLSPSQISIHFAALPGPQRFALGAILFTTLALIGSSVWQAFGLARQNKLLRDRLKGLRQDTLTAHETQTQFDTGIQHLLDSNPEEAIASIDKALTESEQRAVVEHGRNESVDMRDRLDDIRRRQKALREAIGVVADQRRVIEPAFGELKDRQRQLERWLTDLELDDSKNSVADRLKDLTHNVAVIHERKGLLQQSLATLSRFKEELVKSEAELVPLQSPVVGIEALIREVNVNRDILIRTLGEIEVRGDEKLSSRVEALSSNKLEIDAKLAQVFENFQKLDSMRKDIGEIFTGIRATLNRIG